MVTAEWVGIFQDLRDGKVGTLGRVDFDARGAGAGEDLGRGYREAVDVDRMGCALDEYIEDDT